MRRSPVSLRLALAVGLLARGFLASAADSWAGKSLAEVLAGVMSDDPAASSQATAELVRRGPGDVSAILAQAIPVAGQGPDAEAKAAVRTERLVKAVARLGPGAVPGLRDVVQRGRLEGALAAAALGEMGPPAVAAAPTLIAALASKEALVAGGAANALPKLGPGVAPALLEGLEKGNADVRWHCAEALGRLKADPQRVVPALAQGLGDADDYVRSKAAAALGAYGSAARAALPALLDGGVEADDGDFAQALAAVQGAARGELAKVLAADRGRASERAALALAFLRPPAVEELAAALGSPAARVRRAACNALGVAEANGAAPLVARLIDDRDAGVRARALVVLQRLKPVPEGLEPKVAALLADPDPAVRAAAVGLLPQVGRGPEGMHPALPLLADAQVEVRKAAVFALAKRPAGPASVRPLMKALEDGDPFVVELSAAALGKLGPPAREAVPALKRLLQSSDSRLSRAAQAALTALGAR